MELDKFFNFLEDEIHIYKMWEASNCFKPKKGGSDIRYTKSKILRKRVVNSEKYYYKLSFSFKFRGVTDKTFFSYSFPYTFS